MQPVIRFLKTKAPWIGILRYALALGMLPYAISKIFLTQFIIFPFDSWQNTLENTSGIGLTWSFLGYAPWFQFLLGFFELVPAALLLFRRTALTGAILMLPLTLNVMLINYALDLWQETQRISLIFFVLNMLILIIEWKKLAAGIKIILDAGRKISKIGIESVINFLLVAVLFLMLVPELLEYRRSSDLLTGDWLHNRPNQWTLQSESIGDSLVPLRDQVLYFQAMKQYRVLQAGEKVQTAGYDLNEKQKTLLLKDYEHHSPARFSYTTTGDSILQLTSDKNWIQVYKRRVVNKN